jgi:hypothetical protein
MAMPRTIIFRVMPFAYYRRLSRGDRAIYDRSDSIAALRLPDPEPLRPVVAQIAAGLGADDRAAVEQAARTLVAGLVRRFEVEPVDVAILAVRPSLPSAELHGLYTRGAGRRPRIRVWMRTVHYKLVVAFRTFLRTILHEVGHHLDYTLLALPESFHTEGFYKRESSLFYQLVPRQE